MHRNSRTAALLSFRTDVALFASCMNRGAMKLATSKWEHAVGNYLCGMQTAFAYQYPCVLFGYELLSRCLLTSFNAMDFIITMDKLFNS